MSGAAPKKKTKASTVVEIDDATADQIVSEVESAVLA